MSDITLSDLRVLSPHEPNRHATLSVDTRKATSAGLVAALRDHEGVEELMKHARERALIEDTQ